MRENDLLALRMECTLFFEENPFSYETEEGLAMRLGREPEMLKPVLDQLVQLSILEKMGEDPRYIYCYHQPDILLEVPWNVK